MKKVSRIIQGQLQDNVKVVIPKNVMNKINYLCTVIAAVEWSGVLFYTVKGTIKNPSKMVITLKDILPMDKGTTTATEFTYDERYVEYLMNEEKRMEYKSGLIHSHNNMAVFYSGTDQEELKINSKAHNFYLSVVVNNKLDIIGRIGVSALAEAVVETSYKGLDEDGNVYEIESTNLKVKNEKLFYIDCDMVYEKPKSAIEDEFLNNVATILKPKTPISYSKTVSKPSYNTPAYEGLRNNYDNYSDWGHGGYTGYEERLPATRFSNTATVPRKVSTPKSHSDFDSHIKKECYKFLVSCFGFDNEDEEVLLEDIFQGIREDLQDQSITIPEVIEDFAFGFNSSYDVFFHNTIYGVEIILTSIEEILEEHTDEYKFVKEIKNILRKI